MRSSGQRSGRRSSRSASNGRRWRWPGRCSRRGSGRRGSCRVAPELIRQRRLQTVAKPKEGPMANKDVAQLKLIESKILLIRGQRVMLSHHLAELYGVEAKALVQSV